MSGQLNSWFIKVGGPVPYLPDEVGERLFRAGRFEIAMREAGHRTLWFSSDFIHKTRQMRNLSTNRPYRPSDDAPEMVFLSSPGYRRNFGLDRFWDHVALANSFEATVSKLPRPDIIYCSYPVIDLAAAAVRYGLANRVPVIVDVRDLWPDVIYERLASITRLGSLFPHRWMIPYERSARFTFTNATSVIGVADGMVDWAHSRFGRVPSTYDRTFYQTQPTVALTEYEAARAAQAWRSRGVNTVANVKRFVWAGALSTATDVPTLIRAIRRLPDAIRTRIEIVVCGTGKFQQELARFSLSYPCVKVCGWVPHTELTYLLRHSIAGLMCYLDRFDFQRSIPNKVVDYTSEGLRIITGVSGEIEHLTHGTGVLQRYIVGDADSLARTFIDAVVASDQALIDAKAKSRALYETHFDAKRVLPEFVSHVERIAEEIV